MSVVLIGPPAAGKTRAGKRLSQRLHATFADTDKLFAREHGAIAEFIPRHGEAEFRRIEREIVAQAITEYDIVSLGGGAILDERTQHDLAASEHTVVLLIASPAAIEERIAGRKNRPLLTGIDSWIATYEARKPIYDRLADIRVDTSFRPMWQVVVEIKRHLKRLDSPLVRRPHSGPAHGTDDARPADDGMAAERAKHTAEAIDRIHASTHSGTAPIGAVEHGIATPRTAEPSPSKEPRS